MSVAVDSPTLNATGWGAGIFIGASFSGGEGWHFEGSIDDVRLYDRVISPEEISRIYGLGATTKINKTTAIFFDIFFSFFIQQL